MIKAQSKIFIILVLISTLPFYTNARNETDSLIAIQENLIVEQLQSFNRRSTHQYNRAVNDSVLNLITRLANMKESISYDFSNLKNNMTVLSSPDKKFVLYNWNYVNNKNEYFYYAILQVLSKDKNIHIVHLKDSGNIEPNLEYKTLTQNDWTGVAYYDMIMRKTKERTYYTLLGWDGRDLFTNRKVIDVLYFENDTSPMFGSPIFNVEKGKLSKNKSRIIFTYSYKTNITLVYNNKLDMIVFDHVSPTSPKYEGHYEYYGADFSYDGLDFRDNEWFLVEDVDVKNPPPPQKKKRR
jgi:hypothetical protein